MTLSSKLYAGTKTQQMLAPATYSTDQLSVKFDLQDYSDFQIIADVGAANDTWSGTDKIEIEVQDSDDDSTYAATADANISNAVSGTNTGTMVKLTNSSAQQNQTYACAYRGNKRYVKVAVNFSGTHGSGSVIGIIGQGSVSRAQPVNAG
jgi:hypothetical protein